MVSQQVLAVLNRTSVPSHHILFGPPGTGKTTTVVEAIEQVWRMIPGSRILVTAPSNTAADLLAERLLKDVDKEQILRWMSPSRNGEDIKKCLVPITQFEKLDADFILKHRIVITTLTSAARVSGKVRQGTFTHVFVDEAGQATEPETLIPIVGILGQKGQVILSGDPHQLGPVVKSNLGIKYGLGMSLLERLMTQCQLYQKDKDTGLLDKRYITKLKKNFRSHPDLINIPSRLFYEGELQPQVKREKAVKLDKLNWLPKKGFPLVLHCMESPHAKSDKGHSISNAAEVETVTEYLSKVLLRFPPHQVGLLSPYKKQVLMIKEAIQKRFSKTVCKDILVGSTEEFQGQEREVRGVCFNRVHPCILVHSLINLSFAKGHDHLNRAIDVCQARREENQQNWTNAERVCSQRARHAAERNLRRSDERPRLPRQ